MEQACQAYGVPLAVAALHFSLRDPRITATVVGMARQERLAQTLEIMRQPIPPELWPALDALV
jgi:D-threo-aldose 1-dehydrogenase